MNIDASLPPFFAVQEIAQSAVVPLGRVKIIVGSAWFLPHPLKTKNPRLFW